MSTGNIISLDTGSAQAINMLNSLFYFPSQKYGSGFEPRLVFVVSRENK
jgi:hypothetical protein